MGIKAFYAALLAVSWGCSQVSGFSSKHWTKRANKVYLPLNVSDYQSVTAPDGVTIRYKNPHLCETTPGVNSYSGYVDLAPNVHVFFWFFESRRDPAKDPITMWLNGGPGSDSLIAALEENGPCSITKNLTTEYNPYSWNNVSNMLYLSQPVGTGFSYQEQGVGSFDLTGDFLNTSQAAPTGRWPILDPINEGEIDNTGLAAIAAWHVMQALFAGLPKLDAKLGALSPSRDFNLFTESYGGHYGPAFFRYFYEQNQKIEKGAVSGYCLNFNALGIINGIISEEIQAPWYPEFAVNNTYGIKAYNDTVYSYAKFANAMIGGCQDQIAYCRAAQLSEGLSYAYHPNRPIPNHILPDTAAACAEAQDMCRDNVEGPYYSYSGRNAYDIRQANAGAFPDEHFAKWLNIASVQQALGVTVNYTTANSAIYYQFQDTGDFVYPNFLLDLEYILKQDVRVALNYGDADYICNWFGGQAVSLAVQYPHKAQFAAAGYAPMYVDGVEKGEVREYGNFSFLRTYESGHEIPSFQPAAALAWFNRTLFGWDVATGNTKVTADLDTSGPASATHTESPTTITTTDLAEYPKPVSKTKKTKSMMTTVSASSTSSA